MVSLSGGVLDAWRRAVDWVAEKWHCAHDVSTLAHLDLTERERILGEVGLTSQDFYHAMRMPYASRDLSTRAMASLGIDGDGWSERENAWYKDVQRTCMLCPSRRRCGSELERGTFAAHFRNFCANRDSFGVFTKGDTGSNR